MTRSLPARTRVLAAGVALLLTVGALAGCSDRPGQAADMTFTGLDGASHSIVVTEKDIDVVAKDMEPKPGQQTGQQRQTPTRVDIAGALIEAPIIEEVGKAHGITITDAEIVQLAKEQLGFEPRRASTLTYLRANLLFNQFRQQQAQAQAIVADLSKLRATMSGDRSPRYPDSAPAWWTQEDPRLQSANNPAGGGQQQTPQQQAPQQGGGQQQPQQQAPQQGGQQQNGQQAPQQPQQGGQQQAPQQGGAEQPSDSGQTENDQTDGGAGEGGQDTGQAEGNGQ
ncbi:hypothetical protein [Actinomyces naeslundii]|uniref:hypothetical protein n=1 Tax=Actinomyces naeslundii TaxID=1655 RepID=UPI003FA009A2